MLTAAFLLGAAITGSIEAGVEVFVFGHFDRKFRDPRVAFEAALYAAAAMGAIGAVVVGIAALLWRRRLAVSRRAVALLFFFGAAHPLIAMVAAQVDGARTIGIISAWVAMIAVPVLAVYAAAVPR